MKARLKTLPDYLRGGAWPPSVRTVRRPVKSGNERDPYPLLLTCPVRGGEYTVETAGAKSEEGWSTVGQYAPNIPGYTRATMDWTMGNDTERWGQSLKPVLSPD